MLDNDSAPVVMMPVVVMMMMTTTDNDDRIGHRGRGVGKSQSE